MTHWWRGNFPGAPGVQAIYEEPPGGGAMSDINAPRNAPAKDPASNLSRLTWHIDFFQYGVVKHAVRSIRHDKLAGRKRFYGVDGEGRKINGSSSDPGGGAAAVMVVGQTRTSSITLFPHNLGYVPIFFVALDDHTLPLAYPVQVQSGGRLRTVSAFATKSIIGLTETAFSTDRDLAAVSRDYEVWCCEFPDPQGTRSIGNSLKLLLAGGKVDSDTQYMRRALAHESSLDMDLAPTAAYTNGGRRTVTGGHVIDDDAYDGHFSGPDFIAVGF